MSGEQPTLPAFYLRAFEQLRKFQVESTCPKTGNFPWCARPSTVVEVTEFLTSAHAHDLVEPTLTLGIDGAVSVIWHEKAWWISADFSNAAYIYAISRVPGNGHPGVIKAGHSPTNVICDVMIDYVRQVYQDKQNE